ncbi:MAG: hypothetical protein MJ126_04415 [Lachnospiraceae bacterium]|nr:hypothetical protein [Lachnospiraceae bacterium]
MEKTEMFIMSGNYFTTKYALMLTTNVKKLDSSCYVIYEDVQVSLKSEYDVSQLSDIIPGKRLKITCFNLDYQQALSDLNAVRKLIEHDFTTAIEPD